MKWYDMIKETLHNLKTHGSLAEAEQYKTKMQEAMDAQKVKNDEAQKITDQYKKEADAERKRIADEELNKEKLKKAKWDAIVAENKAKAEASDKRWAENNPTPTEKPKDKSVDIVSWLSNILGIGNTPTPPEATPTTTPTPMDVGGTNGILGYSRGSIDPQYVDLINQAIANLGTGTSLTPSLLGSGIFSESGFNPNAYNNGDRGIAQFSSKWRPDITDEVAYNPKLAIPEMARTLNDYINNTGSIPQGMAAYNVGQGRVGLADGRNEYGLGPKGMNYIRKIAANLSKEEAQKLGLDIFQ